MRKVRPLACRPGPTGLILSLALLALFAPPLRARGGDRHDRLPYRLTVEVSPGEATVAQTLREELEFEIFRELDSAGCFRAVRSAAPEMGDANDLLLDVTVDRVEERTDFQISLAQRSNPDAPPDAGRQFVARVELQLRLELRTLEGSAPVRSKRIHLERAYRPVLDEDAQEAVRIVAVEEAARVVRSWACKGSAKRLREQIERAVADRATER